MSHSDHARLVARCVRKPHKVLALLAPIIFVSSSATALTLTPIFDSSVTSNPNAALIENAINTVSSELGSSFSNAAIIKFNVSWGSAGGASIPTYDVSASVENLSGPYSFSAFTADLRSVAAANPNDAVLQSVAAHLPKSNPAGSLSYGIPYAEAQAIGLLPPASRLPAGAIGFSNAVKWDFDPTDGVAANTYDLEGAAAHEIMEVLGRISGLQSARPTLATPLDLFRYTAAGVSSFSYSTAAYFSVDGGQTAIEHFNVTGSGDRSDIASAPGLTDVQAAYLPTGVALTLSAADLTLLDALGWGAFTAPQYGGAPDPFYLGSVQSFGGAVPEPASWALMLIGFTGAGFAVRSKTRTKAGLSRSA